jgi:phage terminase small subunit
MPALRNARHERFAQELSKGKSQTEAYEQAGYRPSRSAAARLAADVNICARVSEIAERVAVRTELTVAAVTDRLLRIADVAEKTGVEVGPTGEATASSSRHLGVARAALMDAAKLNGLVIEKSEETTAGALTVTYVTSASGAQPAPSDEDYETAE